LLRVLRGGDRVIPEQVDALIVGAGPAGSTAAILLARAGWSVALIERQRFPRRKVCGECIAASNLPLLAALGIGAALERLAGPELREAALLHGAHEAAGALAPARDERFAWGRALGRETLDTLLLEQARAEGVQVLQPWSVEALAGAPGQWRCALRSVDDQTPATLRAELAVVANGSWELLPAQRERRRGLRGAGDLFAFKANFLHAGLQAGRLPVLCLDGGYGGMVLADGGVTTLACCVRRDRLDALRAATPGVRAGDAVEAWLRRSCTGVDRALRGARREGPWLAVGPIDPGIRLRRDDALFRIGNAAGEAHPILGEGMSMALQSAALFCTLLLAAPTGTSARSAAWQREVSRRYAGQWRRQFAPRLRLAALFAHAAMRPASSAVLLALVRAYPSLLARGARWGGKTRCAVDPGPLAARPA